MREEGIRLNRVVICFEDKMGFCILARIVAYPSTSNGDAWNFAVETECECEERFEVVENIMKLFKKRRKRIVKTLEQLRKVIER